jgi:hypothetical protein
MFSSEHFSEKKKKFLKSRMKSANPSEDGGPGEIQTGPLSTQA